MAEKYIEFKRINLKKEENCTTILKETLYFIKMAQTKMEKLDELKQMLELPNLYLANYFSELRNKVDQTILEKQLLFSDDKEKQNKLNEIWRQLIQRIDTFEEQSTINSDENKINVQTEAAIKRIHSIETILSNSDPNIDLLNKIEKEIQIIQVEILRKLFQNKTIALVKSPVLKKYRERVPRISTTIFPPYLFLFLVRGEIKDLYRVVLFPPYLFLFYQREIKHKI